MPEYLALVLVRNGKSFLNVLFCQWKGLKKTQNPQQQRSKVIHINHLQSLILATVQCRARCNYKQSGCRVNQFTQSFETAISQLVLHNSGALLNHRLCQQNTVQPSTACCCWPALPWHTPASSAAVVYHVPKPVPRTPHLILNSNPKHRVFNLLFPLNTKNMQLLTVSFVLAPLTCILQCFYNLHGVFWNLT